MSQSIALKLMPKSAKNIIEIDLNGASKKIEEIIKDFSSSSTFSALILNLPRFNNGTISDEDISKEAKKMCVKLEIEFVEMLFQNPSFRQNSENICLFSKNVEVGSNLSEIVSKNLVKNKV